MPLFYLRDKEWRRTRERVLRRDGYRCAVPGCSTRASVVDHLVSRRAGGSDAEHNLRSLCGMHDRQIKEIRRGSAERRRGGVPTGVCDRDGLPMDPSHPWHRRSAARGGG